jgi:hypothetical protein
MKAPADGATAQAIEAAPKTSSEAFEYEQQEQTCERAVVEAKAALGEEAFAAARARGEPMTPEEIVAFAVAE